MDCCKMINDEHQEHKLHCHIVCAYCHEGKLLGKFMTKPYKTPSSELADIAMNHFAIRHAWEQVSHSTKPVDVICHDRHRGANTSHNGNGYTPPAPSRDCTCSHIPDHNNCPTWNAVCNRCSKRGHWCAKCHSSGTAGKHTAKSDGAVKGPHHWCCERGKKANIVQVSTEETPPCDELFVDALDCGTVGDTHPEEIVINDVCTPRCNEAYTMVKLPTSISSKRTASLCVKVYIKPGGNVLPLHVFWHLHPDQISPAGLPTGLDHISTRFTTYNGSHIPLYGAFHGHIIWQPGSPGIRPCQIKSYLYIADTPGPAILGLPSCKRLMIMKINCAITVMWLGTKPPSPAPASTIATTAKPATVHTAAKSIRSTDDLIKEFPDWFTGIGRFPGKYKIWLQHDVHPMIHAPRKCPIALHPKVKEHLNKMECLGVITHVDEPTDWVSSITYVQKANGELCLCLDPCDLNEAICWDHHKVPTVEEVAHKFVHSRYFTKLDAHHGYWSVVLDQESSLLTTFNSPFGRYHFLWLPFDLVCSQDIFQKKMDQILEECHGSIGITDDITVHGHTEADHGAHLQNLMQITHRCDLVFNPQKPCMKAQAVNFFGCLSDANGVHLDPGKVYTVHALLAPTNVTELQEFLGLVKYLGPFIPFLSTLTAPLHELLKDTDFTWNGTYDAAFQHVKEAVVSDTTLRYFDPSLPVTIQVNASQVGLGAALLQNGKPLAFASKALTETECQYANIERERC